MLMDTKPIHIYKASAGAGKTFTLAAEFIANLINDYRLGDQPHRHQLAITFTRKATTEMKERILQSLYAIAHSTDASDGFFQAVRARVDRRITDEQIRTYSGRVLVQILHGYDRFHVTTIDSFFQALLTNLAHELGLSAGFKVDLNDKNVLSKAVDQLLQTLRPDSDLLQWITGYIEEQIDEDKNWNVARQIKRLGNELLKEPYLLEGDRLRQVEGVGLTNQVVKSYRDTLNQKKEAIKAKVKRTAAEIDAFIRQSEGYENISHGKNVATKMEKLREWNFKNVGKELPFSDTLSACTTDPLRLLTKANQKQDRLVVWAEEVSHRLHAFKPLTDDALPIINSCELSTQHLNTLRLLDEIDKQVHALNHENNAFMLAHTPILFHKMVSGAEASFVFERAGVQFRHIMIDEFQDTSSLQWANLRHLFVENIAQGNSCMLVGDVKQGIYRWRGGDWTALAALRDSETTQIEQLDSNFRSGRNIVDCNNRLFVELARVLQTFENHPDEVDAGQDIGALYAEDEVAQRPRNAGGFVRIKIEGATPKKDKKGKKDEEPDEVPEEEDTFCPEDELGSQILRLHQTGVPFERMAILVRKKEEINKVIRHFEESEAFQVIPIVSDEAFLLEASPAVQTIVHALRYIALNGDGIAEAYLRRHAPKGLEQHVFEQLLQWRERYRFPQRDLPFYHLVQQIIVLFALDKDGESHSGQSPYLYAFLDAILQFLDSNVPNLKAFLQHWDEKLHEQSIPSTVVKGVRILTIHKSKGLAFHSVFIPYCHWHTEKNRNDDLLWMKPTSAPYNRLPLLPISVSSKTEQSIYAPDYRKEHRSRRIENLNLMYVAFTRARQNLIVCAPINKSPGDSMHDILRRALFDLDNHLRIPLTEEGQPSPSVSIEDDCLTLEIGQPSLRECTPTDAASEKAEPHNPLQIDPTAEPLHFCLYDSKACFRQSNNAAAFVQTLRDDAAEAMPEAAPEVSSASSSDSALQQGRLLHRMMEHIETAADVERVVADFRRTGKMVDPTQIPQLIALLHSAVTHPVAQSWFDGSWRLYRECNILLRDAQGRPAHQRPDRVMMRGEETVIVDYKFGRSNPAYHKQVRQYADLLRRMGRTHLRGYLWYVHRGELEEVDLA